MELGCGLVVEIVVIQESEMSAFHSFRDELQNDEAYAWSWHCNIAMAFVDEGSDRVLANNAAARFMKNAFGIDVTTFSEWKAIFKDPKPLGEYAPLDWKCNIDTDGNEWFVALSCVKCGEWSCYFNINPILRNNKIIWSLEDSATELVGRYPVVEFASPGSAKDWCEQENRRRYQEMVDKAASEVKA